MLLFCSTWTWNICRWSHSQLQRMSWFCTRCWSVHIPSVHKQPG